MMSRRRVVLGVGAGVAVLAALLVAVFVLARGSGAAPVGAGSHAIVFVDGHQLQPPFDVTTQGGTVLVNGTPAADFAALTADDVRPTPAAGDDAFTIVSEVRRAYLDAGGGDQGVTAALSMLRTHPAAPQFAELQDPHAIQVTDASGETGTFRIDVPDAVARPTSDKERAQRAKDTADNWRGVLAQGGGVVASRAGGVTLTLPPERVQPFLDGLAAAQAQSGAARDAALAALLDAPGLITDFGGTPPPITPRPGASREPGAQQLISLRPGAAPLATAPAPAAAGKARTPGKAEAIVFAMTVLDDSDSQPFVEAAQKEHYSVLVYRDPKDGLYVFTKTSNTGALYIVSHSSPGSLAVEHFANAEGINAEMHDLQQRGARRGDMSWWSDAHGGFWLDITRAGINRLWFGAQTIVHAASCEGESLFNVFGAREFFGYHPTTSCAIALPDTRELWGRMSGVIGNGQYRYADAAYSSGHYSPGFTYHSGAGGEQTALSPSVVSADIPQDLEVGTEGAVLIGFDTVMDTNAAADGVVALLGCLQRSGPAQWQFDSLLSVPVRATGEGTATVTVSEALATSAGPAFIHLDGNETPPRTSGVAPNKDDWEGAGGCRQTPQASETSTSSTTGTESGPPAVVPIHAEFDQSTFTTTYTEQIDPAGLTFAWSVSIPADPGCASGFKGGAPAANQAAWFHADKAQGGPCSHDAEGPNGHPGTVTVIVTSAQWRCEAHYAGTNTGDGDPAQCVRK